ncbi:hypothetical protein pgond44_05670 [Psychroflexus gondwanensis ACAM 44]|uniref:Tox-MPTase3 domain-containing protein n=1 Tax=Psychroflexus gondwanensis ACAM 44 TaxID=1189619 RepID=N1WXV2_9FLAO|nr:hypothetical protein [Psychroflexus gondwanensis]EMY82002.1 hypothetical protein pgond44_05670 [Psychroflexus gondwanensis ACAM 44]
MNYKDSHVQPINANPTAIAQGFTNAVAETILHEFVHYGEYQDEEWNSEESGLLFETDVYGQTVWRENALIILKNQ